MLQYAGEDAIVDIREGCIYLGVTKLADSTKSYNVVPHVIEVIPHEDYTVDVTFREGKTVTVNMLPEIKDGQTRHTIYTPLADINDFMGRCTIINNTLAWDIGGKRDAWNCIDVDPIVLWNVTETGGILDPDSVTF